MRVRGFLRSTLNQKHTKELARLTEKQIPAGIHPFTLLLLLLRSTQHLFACQNFCAPGPWKPQTEKSEPPLTQANRKEGADGLSGGTSAGAAAAQLLPSFSATPTPAAKKECSIEIMLAKASCSCDSCSWPRCALCTTPHMQMMPGILHAANPWPCACGSVRKNGKPGDNA